MKGHIWETLNYFFFRGSFYGMILGAYLGTAFFPIPGTIAGAMLGIMAGMAAGIFSGIIASGIQAFVFHDNIDLEQYSRRLSGLIGLLVGVGAATLVGRYIALLFMEPAGQFENAALFVLVVSALPIFLLASLSSAYTAYHYPAAIVQHTAKRGRLVVPQEAMRPISHEIKDTFYRLARHQPSKWLYLSAGVISFIALLIAALQYLPITPDEFPAILLAGPAGTLASVLAWVYCAFGNAMILSFLKRVIYREHLMHLSLHWSRISLTLISFVLTWAMIWWTIIPAPIIAAAMAYRVYHTLALPDPAYDKEKRKEKNTLALEDEDEEILMEEASLIETCQEG